ncbi:MAG: phospholipase A2 [Desulfurivibrionaceae bacterium]
MKTRILNVFWVVLGLALCVCSNTLAATGQVNVTSHDLNEQVCANKSFVVSGTFILTEDKTPRKHVGSSPYCPGNKPAHYYPRIRLPYSSTSWAYLYYTIDDSSEWERGLAKVRSLDWGNRYNQVGETLNFSFGVNPRKLSPGFHTIDIVFQDLFGVSCLTWWGGYRNSNMSERGDIIDKKSLSFYIPAEGSEDCNSTASSGPVEPNPDPGKRNCQNHKELGSSVDMANGNLFNDHAVSPNSEFPFTLYYNSRSTRESRFGYGWNGQWDMRLMINSDGSIVFIDKDGREVLYSVNSDGSFSAPAGNHDSLEKVGEQYRLLRDDGGFVLFTSEGRPERIEDRNGNRTIYEYDNGNLVRIIDPDGQTLFLTSNSEGRNTEITDASGRTTTFTYDDGSNLTSFTNPAGHTWSFTYDDEHNMVSKTDPLGRATLYTYDDSDRLLSSADSAGNTSEVEYVSETVTRFSDSTGSTSEYIFNEDQKMIRKVDPLGNITEYTWDEDLNKTRVTDSTGTVLHTYDDDGNLIRTVDQMGNETTFTYNEFGQVTSRTNAQGETTVYEYDAKGNLIAMTDPMGNTTSYTYDDQGRVTSITDALARKTSYRYDEEGNVISYTDPTGATSEMTYDQAGNMISMTDAAGRTTTFTYDVLGRMRSMTDPKGNTTTYEYDALGNRTAVTDANGNTSRYKYDHNNRVTRIIDALNQVTTLSYKGTGCSTCGDTGKHHPTGLTDAKGQTTSFTYDKLDRLVKETDPLGNTIRYQYDSAGNLVSRTNPDGSTINYEYDALGRLLARNYPDGTETTFAYDAEGKLVSAANQYISYHMEYDTLGRLTEITDSENRTISYSYDAAGNRVKMITPEGREVTYDYDDANRLNRIDSRAGVFDFDYNLSGRRTSLTYPNGVATSYTYDGKGNLTEILTRGGRGKKGNLLAAFTYTHDNVGNRLTRTAMDRHEHGTRDEYDYDAVYQLLEALPVKLEGKDKPLPNKAENFDYDPVGNRQHGPRENETYTYNRANQLLEGPKYDYQYDKNGNLTSKTGVNDKDQYVSWSYEYDYENRLVRVTEVENETTKVVSFKYDPFGRRIEKQVEDLQDGDSRTYTYVYDNEDIILELLTKTDGRKEKTETSRYLHGPGIDEPLAMEQKGDLYFYHADGLGSITSLTDIKGRVVQSYEYSSYGIPKHQGNRVKQPYTYTGRELDKETGLYFYRARYYDPQLGRFISKDPIGFEGGDFNLYGYVQNNPVNLVDPTGLKCGTWWNDWAVPDNWWGKFCFERACEEHDDCYARCSSDKNQCDEEFRKNMLASCEGLTGTMKTHCKSMATSYYNAVKNLGQSAYNQAQKCCN